MSYKIKTILLRFPPARAHTHTHTLTHSYIYTRCIYKNESFRDDTPSHE